MISDEVLIQLANVSAISAGFIAAIVVYMIATDAYKKFVKLIMVAIFFFAISTIIFVTLTSPSAQDALISMHIEPLLVGNIGLILFSTGWIYISLMFVLASFQVEIVGLRPSLYDIFKWKVESKIQGKYKEPIDKQKVKFTFLNHVITSEFERGICILVTSKLHNYLRNFSFQILAEGINKDEYGIYVLTNMPYHTLITEWRKNKHKKDKMFVIDCYSPLFGFGERPMVGSPSKYQAKDIKTLHEAIRKIRKKIGMGKDYNKVRIVYDSIDLMKFSAAESEIIRLLYHSIPVQKEMGWITIFLCDEAAKETEVGKFLNFIADCKLTIEVKTVDDKRQVCLKVVDMQKKCKWDVHEHNCKTVDNVTTCCFFEVE